MSDFALEMRRILSSGGLMLTYVLSDDDGYLLETNPGSTSITVESTGITDHFFSEERLRQVYKDWEIVVLEKNIKQDSFYGKEYERHLWWSY